ncbi:hypothetical protein ACNKHU_26815 [Shigella flexneri]
MTLIPNRNGNITVLRPLSGVLYRFKDESGKEQFSGAVVKA